MDYYHDFWIGFLSDQIIRQAVETSLLNCAGCRDGLKSPLLHLHQQLSLLDKIVTYFDEIRGSKISQIETLYDQFQVKLPHSSDLNADREIYVKNGRTFLLFATPQSLYHGRYVTEMNDMYINEGFLLAKKRKISKPKKVIKITSQLLT